MEPIYSLNLTPAASGCHHATVAVLRRAAAAHTGYAAAPEDLATAVGMPVDQVDKLRRVIVAHGAHVVGGPARNAPIAPTATECLYALIFPTAR